MVRDVLQVNSDVRSSLFSAACTYVQTMEATNDVVLSQNNSITAMQNLYNVSSANDTVGGSLNLTVPDNAWPTTVNLNLKSTGMNHKLGGFLGVIKYAAANYDYSPEQVPMAGGARATFDSTLGNVGLFPIIVGN